MPRINRISIIGVLSAVVLAATACTDSEGTTPSGDSGTTTESSVETTSAPPPVDVAATPAGTTLAIGQTANIPYDDGFDKAMLGVTVTAIEPGDQAQYAKTFGADAEGSTPFYVRYTLENFSGVDLSTKNLFTLFGSTVKGEEGTGVAIFGDMPGCENLLSPEDFNTVGATFEKCQLVAAPTGQAIVEVGYDGLEYSENPIVWAK